MTDEIRLRANELHRQIEDTQNRISIIADMEDLAHISLYNSSIGSVELPPDIRDEVLGLVLTSFLKQREDLENEYKKL